MEVTPETGGTVTAAGGCSLINSTGMGPNSGTVIFNILILLVPVIIVGLSFR